MTVAISRSWAAARLWSVGMDGTMDYPHFSPCPVRGEKTSNVTKHKPCAACGCTVDDPQSALDQFLLSFPAD